MRATWTFKAVRHGMQRTPIRRTCGLNMIAGSEQDALEFARRAAEHLQVSYVEAWSIGVPKGSAELPNLLTFRMKPHHLIAGHWVAEESRFMHPSWFQKFRHCLDYMLDCRAGGHVCAVEVLNCDGGIQTVILADRRGHDACPYIASSVYGITGFDDHFGQQ